MSSRLPLSPGDFVSDLFERDGDRTSTEALATNNVVSSSDDQRSVLSPSAFCNRNSRPPLISDFPSHYIPPLDTYPPPRSSSRCIMDYYTTTPPGLHFTIPQPANEHTFENDLIQTLPLSIYLPTPLLSVGPNERDRFQHDEYHAFNAPFVPFSHTYMDMRPPRRMRPYLDPGSRPTPYLRGTYRDEDADAPPSYYSTNMRRADQISRAEERLERARQRVHRARIESTLWPPTIHPARCRENENFTVTSPGLGLLSCFAGVREVVREGRKLAKEMRQRSREKRAKGKTERLERHECQ